MVNPSRRLVVVGQPSRTTTILVNWLTRHQTVVGIIFEKPEGLFFYLKRRVRRLGFATVIGQVLFFLLLVPILKVNSRKRIAQLIESNKLDEKKISPNLIVQVDSVNSTGFIGKVMAFKPDLIILSGTRIVLSSVLEHVKTPFINIHAGITPLYRGVHGGYWALANNDQMNCGVTLHYVNSGVDTGEIIAQALIAPTELDNYQTYPYLQLIEGLKLLTHFLNRNQVEAIKIAHGKGSQIWSHPTLWQYSKNRFVYGVK
jgi:hypothetical protein